MNYPLSSYQAHKTEIDTAIQGVLDGGRYILGEQVSLFEQEFSRQLGNPRQVTIGVGCGTDALIISLLAAGITPGDKVATVSFTASATVAAIMAVGAVPVLIDVDETYTLDCYWLEETLKRERDIKAVIPVHLYGQPAKMVQIAQVAQRYGAVVIEDCCQAHGASIYGQPVGTFGKYAAFSFYPTKNLGALGDGGAILCDEQDAAKVRQLRQYGWANEQASMLPGGRCSRLDELQAAVLRVKLRHLNQENARRREIADIYDRELNSYPGVTIPARRLGHLNVFHQYAVLMYNRNGFIEFMADKAALALQIHYPIPCHLQPAFNGKVIIGVVGMDKTYQACKHIVSLPINPHLSNEFIHEVCYHIRDYVW